MKELFELFSRHIREVVVINALFSTMELLGMDDFEMNAHKHFFMCTVMPLFNGGWTLLLPINKEGKEELASSLRIVAERYPKIHINTEDCANTQIGIEVWKY